MLGTICTAKVVEKSPMMRYPLVMMLLKLHISGANYQAYIWRQSLVAQQEQLAPFNHGWRHIDEESCLTVKWIKCKPATDELSMLIPNFYTQMLFNHVQKLNIILNFIC